MILTSEVSHTCVSRLKKELQRTVKPRFYPTFLSPDVIAVSFATTKTRVTQELDIRQKDEVNEKIL